MVLVIRLKGVTGKSVTPCPYGIGITKIASRECRKCKHFVALIHYNCDEYKLFCNKE